METSPSLLHFDSMPAPVRESIFLRLRPSDLETSLAVCSSWRDFVEGEIVTSERNKAKRVVTAHRRVFGKIEPDAGEVEVESLWMLASVDETEKLLYILYKPATGNEWTLKQYSCANGLQEMNKATVLTEHFIKNMQVVSGHLVLFKQPRENAANTPAVFNLLSIPWGGRLPIENALPLPSDAFHVTKLLIGKDCLFVLSKNAQVTWTKGQGGNFTESTHDQFAEGIERPVVVQKLTRMAGAWQDAGKVYPQHGFRVMETFANIPSKDVMPKYKDETCLLYLSKDIITERYLLITCPLHGHYEMYDYVDDFSVWTLENQPTLPSENVRIVLRDALNFSTAVLSAVRRGYVFMYTEEGKATLVSVEDGKQIGQVNGKRFMLTPRFVVSTEKRKDSGFDYTVMDSVGGTVSPTFTFKRGILSSDVYGSHPSNYDEEAIADFEGIARSVLPGGLTWPSLELKAESYWGFGHRMLDNQRMVYWTRKDAQKFKVMAGFVRLKTEAEGAA